MNKRLVIRLLGAILLIEMLAMVPSLIIALAHGDPGDASAMLMAMLVLTGVGLPAYFLAKPEINELRPREGFAVVALGWILLSLFGALPYLFSGFLPNFFDALFEAVSGFTTTGATVLTHFDDLPHGVTFWRSFTHWIGGMGVLVLTLALLPQMTGRTSHLVRAESPGPTLSKIVPKMGDSAKILYTIYGGLTLLMFIALLIAGMNPYEAALHAVGTAGTGGFSSRSGSIGEFGSPAIEIIVTVFMLLFGVNFALYYSLLHGNWKEMARSEELRWFLGLFAGSTIAVTLINLPQYKSFFTSLRYGSFQIASVMSTTGFGTADFNQWVPASQMVILLMMFVGGMVGSTAGGMKVMRVALLCKLGKREIRRTFQPRKVEVVRFEHKGAEDSTLSGITIFFFVYILLILVGAFLLSLENRFDTLTHLTAALTCVSNVGPGLSFVGPAENFAGYGGFGKVVMCVLMLCGRLELFPMLVLVHPAFWKKG